MALGCGRNQREPTQTQGEHGNFTEKDPIWMVDSNPRRSCYEATLLTTASVWSSCMKVYRKTDFDSFALYGLY